MFDRLLLLRRGGETTYFDDMSEHPLHTKHASRGIPLLLVLIWTCVLLLSCVLRVRLYSGVQGDKLVEYMTRASRNIIPYSPLVSPANWMLDVIGLSDADTRTHQHAAADS